MDISNLIEKQQPSKKLKYGVNQFLQFLQEKNIKCEYANTGGGCLVALTCEKMNNSMVYTRVTFPTEDFYNNLENIQNEIVEGLTRMEDLYQDSIQLSREVKQFLISIISYNPTARMMFSDRERIGARRFLTNLK